MPLPTSHSFKALWRRLFGNSSKRRALSHHRRAIPQLWVDRTLFAGTTVTSRWTPPASRNSFQSETSSTETLVEDAQNDACDSTVLVTREQNALTGVHNHCNAITVPRVDFEKTFSTFFQLQVSNTILISLPNAPTLYVNYMGGSLIQDIYDSQGDLTVDAELNYQFLFDSLDKYVFEGEYFSMISEKIIRAIQSLYYDSPLINIEVARVLVMGYDGWNDNNVMPKLQSGCLPIHKIIMEVDERRGRLNFRFSKLVWHGLKFIGATDLQKCLPLMDIIDSTAQVISRAALENVGQVDDARKWHLKCREVAVNLFLNHWLACREDEPIWDDPL